MKSKKPTRAEIITEWLELFPLRKLEYETDENNRVVVFLPHKENFLTRKFLPRPKSPAARIKLDEIGSFVWQLCDGSNSIRTICHRLQENFGDTLIQSEERTVMFLQQMYKENFIKLLKQS